VSDESLRILLLGDYSADSRLGSTKVYYKLREEFVRLGHVADLMLSDQLGPRPRAPKLRWAIAPVLAAWAVGRAPVKYDVIDVASAEGAILGLTRLFPGRDGPAIVSRSHGLEHRNYQRLLEDHEAGLVQKGWHRRWWYPVARLSQVSLAARLADRLIVLNAGDRDFAATRGWKPIEAIDVIPHGVSERFLTSAPERDTPRGAGILFCGTWDDVKGVSYLAAAFSLLLEAVPAARLTVLGAGVSDEAVRARFAPSARHAVTVLPRAAEEEVMRQYRAHDILVLPSTYEGFGMVVLEAMSQRLPVVATPVGCAPMLIRDRVTGKLVPPRSANALAAAMKELLEDAPLRARIASAAYPLAAAHTWALTARQSIESYRKARAAWGEQS
jgi:glycosyltransferase involved in cell wall biosynthesis